MTALLPFVMAGDPSLDVLPKLLSDARAAGIEAIEVGLPHSDPIADGPVLQAAAQRALTRGVTAERVLETLARCDDVPDLVLFSYLNPLLQMGTERLLALLAPTKVRSLLVVDWPHGEEAQLESALREAEYPLVPLIAPTTSVARARALLAERPDPGAAAPFAQRFVYVVARLGITGERTVAFAPIAERVAALRALTDRPLAVGFGLREPEDLARVRAMGATPVIGSALVAALRAGKSTREVWASMRLAFHPQALSGR